MRYLFLAILKESQQLKRLLLPHLGLAHFVKVLADWARATCWEAVFFHFCGLGRARRNRTCFFSITCISAFKSLDLLIPSKCTAFILLGIISQHWLRGTAACAILLKGELRLRMHFDDRENRWIDFTSLGLRTALPIMAIIINIDDLVEHRQVFVVVLLARLDSEFLMVHDQGLRRLRRGAIQQLQLARMQIEGGHQLYWLLLIVKLYLINCILLQKHVQVVLLFDDIVLFRILVHDEHALEVYLLEPTGLLMWPLRFQIILLFLRLQLHDWVVVLLVMSYFFRDTVLLDQVVEARNLWSAPIWWLCSVSFAAEIDRRCLIVSLIRDLIFVIELVHAVAGYVLLVVIHTAFSRSTIRPASLISSGLQDPRCRRSLLYLLNFCGKFPVKILGIGYSLYQFWHSFINPLLFISGIKAPYLIGHH